MTSSDMSTVLAGVRFPNPVFTASGCAAAGQELDQFFDVSSLGGVVTKSIMTQARSGRATPRMAETPSGSAPGSPAPPASWPCRPRPGASTAPAHRPAAGRS